MNHKSKTLFKWANGVLRFLGASPVKKNPDPSILIMVLSCKKPPFNSFMQTQMQTWDSIEVPGIETLFYVGDDTLEKPQIEGKTITVCCSDDYPQMHWKFKKALSFVKDWPFDFVFRTNASAYVCKKKLKDFAKKLPASRCYCGIQGPVSNGNFNHVNGGGIFLSRDVALILEEKLQFNQTPHIEDGEIAKVLLQEGIGITPGGRRTEYEEVRPRLEGYHVRCRSKTHKRGPYEIKAMQTLFELDKAQQVSNKILLKHAQAIGDNVTATRL